MSANCTHATTVVVFGADGFSIELCTWECQKYLISVDQPNGITITVTVDELAAKDEALSKALMALEVVRKSYPNMVHEVLDFVDAALAKATP